MAQQVFQKIKQTISEARRILVISHKNPDGDACGSILAVWFYLRSLDKEARMLLIDQPPSYFEFLPGFEEISHNVDMIKESWDVVVFCDVGDPNHSGIDLTLLAEATIINIDHHWTNNNFGHINHVDIKSSSASEIIYNFFQAINFVIDKNIATCLLAGILNDTGGFSNLATTVSSMAVASDLIRRGARINNINKNVVRNKSVNGLRLWGLVLSRFRISDKWGIAYTYVKASDFKNYQVSEEELDGLSNFLNVLSDVSAAMFFKIGEGKTKVNLRTTRDSVDVSILAKAFGGGGHKKAAGFTLDFELQEKNGQLEVPNDILEKSQQSV